MTEQEQRSKEYYGLLYFICVAEEILQILAKNSIITHQREVEDYWKKMQGIAFEKYAEIQRKGKISSETLDKILKDFYLKNYRNYFEARFFRPEVIPQLDRVLTLLKIKS
jgi:hypothetical protein